jgi:hypothetical protein
MQYQLRWMKCFCNCFAHSAPFAEPLGLAGRYTGAESGWQGKKCSQATKPLDPPEVGGYVPPSLNEALILWGIV